MIHAENHIFLPTVFDDILDMINHFYPEEISVVDIDGKVHGSLSDEREVILNLSGRVEIWLGAEYAGLSCDNMAEATLFLQGLLIGLTNFNGPESIAENLQVLDHIGGGFYEKARLLYARYTGQEITETDINFNVNSG